jgi:Terpene synthase family, metal binding domain
MENLPEYMQLCFLALLNLLNNTAYEVLKERGLNVIQYLRRAVIYNYSLFSNAILSSSCIAFVFPFYFLQAVTECLN